MLYLITHSYNYMNLHVSIYGYINDIQYQYWAQRHGTSCRHIYGH